MAMEPNSSFCRETMPHFIEQKPKEVRKLVSYVVKYVFGISSVSNEKKMNTFFKSSQIIKVRASLQSEKEQIPAAILSTLCSSFAPSFPFFEGRLCTYFSSAEIYQSFLQHAGRPPEISGNMRLQRLSILTTCLSALIDIQVFWT